ncbi:hypothetical protein [Nitrospira sp. Ecomares 2.1]
MNLDLVVAIDLFCIQMEVHARLDAVAVPHQLGVVRQLADDIVFDLLLLLLVRRFLIRFRV